MSAATAELSSLATAIEDVQRRITGIAGRYEGTEHDDVLGALYDAERNLRAAHRQVERAARLL